VPTETARICRLHWGALLAAGLFLAACSRGSSPSPALRVVVDDQSLKPSVSSTAPGPVRFEVMNQGALEHELVVLRTDLPAAGLRMHADEDTVDEDASGQKVGEIEDIAPREQKSETFNLAAGHYVLFCNVLGHYHQGLAINFEVK